MEIEQLIITHPSNIFANKEYFHASNISKTQYLQQDRMYFTLLQVYCQTVHTVTLLRVLGMQIYRICHYKPLQLQCKFHLLLQLQFIL